MWTFQNLWTLDLWNVSAVKMMFLLQFHFLSTFWSTVDNSKKGKEILFLIPFAFIYLSHNVPKLNNLTNPKISSYQVFIYWSIRALQCSPQSPYSSALTHRVFSFRSRSHCCCGTHISGVVRVGGTGPGGFYTPDCRGYILYGSE